MTALLLKTNKTDFEQKVLNQHFNAPTLKNKIVLDTTIHGGVKSADLALFRTLLFSGVLRHNCKSCDVAIQSSLFPRQGQILHNTSTVCFCLPLC